MAQTSTSFFTILIPTFVWLKLQSFLQGIHDDNNVSEEPNHQSPNSSPSSEQPSVPPTEYRLDIEVFGNNHGTSTLPPSPETTTSETSPTSSIIQDSSSRGLRLRLTPNLARNSIAKQHTESDSTPQTTTQTPQQEPLHPIVQIFQDQELGKAIIGFVMPMTAALLNPYVPIPAGIRKVIFLSLSLGLVALWNGILLRQTLPRAYAMAIEQLGAALVLVAFYALVNSFLPASLIWLTSICMPLAVFPFLLSYLRRLTDQ